LTSETHQSKEHQHLSLSLGNSLSFSVLFFLSLLACVSQCKNFTNFLCKIAGFFSSKFLKHSSTLLCLKVQKICITGPSKKEMERSKKLRATPKDSPRTRHAKPGTDHETKKSYAGH
jgi:hypothetical protein